MLKKILSISGRPGLFRLVNQGRNMLIVEALATGKRMPAYARDRVVSLGDISMYTADGGDTPLSQVLESLKEVAGGEKVDIKAIGNDDAIREYFGRVLPDYDRDRVYTADIRKLLQWYNLLIEAGITEFVATEKEEDAEETPTEE